MDELDYDDAVLRTRSSEKLTGDFESLWQILDLTRRENRFRTSRYSHDRRLIPTCPLLEWLACGTVSRPRINIQSRAPLTLLDIVRLVRTTTLENDWDILPA